MSDGVPSDVAYVRYSQSQTSHSEMLLTPLMYQMLHIARPASDAKPLDALTHHIDLRHLATMHQMLSPHPTPLHEAPITLMASLKLSSGAIENMHSIFTKRPNSAPQARREGESILNPSLPLKLHLLFKCANTTKCTPCACVLAFL